jgi:hypothetical protein
MNNDVAFTMPTTPDDPTTALAGHPGYTQPWYSVQGVEAPAGRAMADRGGPR